ncbi:MAG TPA: endonuclease/exonuclease/phosphatase family protein [Planctomycetota bacterium]|nr:endonuclease/exonuclease/phosphatase family protein [Planctomycetota bacterium]
MRERITNLVAVLALPALGPAVAPYCASWHWTIDLLACFPVQALGWLLVAGAILLAARRWRLAAFLLGGAGLAATSILPVWCRAGAAPHEGGAPLRLLGVNLLRGNELQMAEALDAVRGAAPDVIFCAEVTPAWLEGLGPGLPDFPHRYLHADPGYYGVALFSRLPLREVALVPLGVPWAPAIRAIVDTRAGPIGLLGVHTPRPGSAERNENRDRALAAIGPALASLPEARVVLGDFNATPWNPAFRAMLADAALADASAGAASTTWPAVLPWPLRIPIDHVLTSANVGREAVAVGADFGSDHLPLLAELRLHR